MCKRLAKDRGILGAEGELHFLLGNEAIARGTIEAGVHMATTYPGTPASEINDSLAEVAREVGMKVEYSTNEIVAVETAAGVAICGGRALVSMKHVGLNVASDALMTLAYVGVRGGFVIVSADDPYRWSSQNEQDNRYYALMGNIPCLEPSNPQEAKDMLLQAFQLSERLELPVMLRLVTRVSHMRGVVSLGSIAERGMKLEPPHDSARFVMVPINARVRHCKLLEKEALACQLAAQLEFNKVYGEGEVGVITAGSAFNYTMEALDVLGVKASVLKLGMIHPLSPELVKRFLGEHKRVAVIEELENQMNMKCI